MNRHIVEQQLEVDAQDLVSYLERLILEIIITLRTSFHKGPEGMILPRSWILRALKGASRSPCQNPILCQLFEPVGTLLTRLYNWSGHGELPRPRKYEQHMIMTHRLVRRVPSAKWFSASPRIPAA